MPISQVVSDPPLTPLELATAFVSHLVHASVCGSDDTWMDLPLRGAVAIPMLAEMLRVAPISLLVSYHRNYDAKILLLTIPACGQLWSEGGVLGRVAAGVSGITFLLDGDLSITAIFEVEKKLRHS
jgi:hypothetical protein